jgi:methyl-accepting chemotaxis protein
MSNLTIGQKIGGGFTALILLAGLLGALATFTMRSVSVEAHQMSAEFVPEAKLGGALNDAVARTQLATRSYGFTADDKYLKEIHLGLEQIGREFAALRKLSEAHPQLVKLRAHLSEIEPAIREYQAAVKTTETQNHLIHSGRERLNTTSAQFIANIDAIIKTQHEHLDREARDFAGAEKVVERHLKLRLVTEIRGEGNAARIAVFKAQALRTPATISEGLANFEAMEKHFTELKSLLKAPADIKEMGEAQAAAHAYRAEMQEIMKTLLALDEIAARRSAIGARLDKLADEIATTGMERTVLAAEESSQELSRASRNVLLTLGLAIALGIAVATVIIRGISGVLRTTTDSLTTGAEQIAAAAHQVSGSAQSLASGASEQAASLEETSASIEQMSGMTKRNADSANQAKDIAQVARHSADSSASSVAKLNTAMGDLKVSSSEVAKIVKTIDEIAFQTNILALNAAVEAARAGEAGAGFAVVAEEVRSLAQRSAQAAKETAGKIEAAVVKSEEGARISEEVSTSLGGIIEQVRKLDALITEIAHASSEQAQGIEQVNTAVSQMDKVTQANAAAAEESASAAEEMNAQTAELNALVGNLLLLVGGRRSNDATGTPGTPLPGGKRRRDNAPPAKTSVPRAPRATAPAKPAAPAAELHFE